MEDLVGVRLANGAYYIADKIESEKLHANFGFAEQGRFYNLKRQFGKNFKYKIEQDKYFNVKDYIFSNINTIQTSAVLCKGICGTSIEFDEKDGEFYITEWLYNTKRYEKGLPRQDMKTKTLVPINWELMHDAPENSYPIEVKLTAKSSSSIEDIFNGISYIDILGMKFTGDMLFAEYLLNDVDRKVVDEDITTIKIHAPYLVVNGIKKIADANTDMCYDKTVLSNVEVCVSSEDKTMVVKPNVAISSLTEFPKSFKLNFIPEKENTCFKIDLKGITSQVIMYVTKSDSLKTIPLSKIEFKNLDTYEYLDPYVYLPDVEYHDANNIYQIQSTMDTFNTGKIHISLSGLPDDGSLYTIHVIPTFYSKLISVNNVCKQSDITEVTVEQIKQSNAQPQSNSSGPTRTSLFGQSSFGVPAARVSMFGSGSPPDIFGFSDPACASIFGSGAAKDCKIDQLFTELKTCQQQIQEIQEWKKTYFKF